MPDTYINDKQINEFSDEIDFKSLIDILLHGKWVLISITSFISILGVIFSLLSPNIYESRAILIPVDASTNIGGSLGGGLAGLAGIDLSSSSGIKSNTTKAYNKITSLSFFENSIMPNIFLPDLMALNSWDQKTNKLIYDEKKYDINSNKWIRKFSYPSKQVPSAQESFKVFKSKHFNISQDKKTGIITLKIKHKSPFIAKQWSDLLIREINIFYTLKDKSEAQKSVNYLYKEITQTNLSEIKTVIAELIQKETQKLTLIEAKQSYVFEYIDPPAAMEKKSEPNRFLIVILSAMFGGILSIVILFSIHFIKKKKYL